MLDFHHRACPSRYSKPSKPPGVPAPERRLGFASHAAPWLPSSLSMVSRRQPSRSPRCTSGAGILPARRQRQSVGSETPSISRRPAAQTTAVPARGAPRVRRSGRLAAGAAEVEMVMFVRSRVGLTGHDMYQNPGVCSPQSEACNYFMRPFSSMAFSRPAWRRGGRACFR